VTPSTLAAVAITALAASAARPDPAPPDDDMRAHLELHGRVTNRVLGPVLLDWTGAVERGRLTLGSGAGQVQSDVDLRGRLAWLRLRGDASRRQVVVGGDLIWP